MDYQGNDFYCDIAIPGKVELKKEFENEHVLAFYHTKPHWPVHIVVVPKKHIASFTNRSNEDEAVFQEVLKVVREITTRVEKEHGAARILTNLGTYQDSKHLHFHINSGTSLR